MVISPLRACALVEPSSSARVKLPINTSISGQAILKISGPWSLKNLAERPQNPYGPLRDLVRPYILRRLKTDKSIIADLPDKAEVKTFCPLSRKQAALYQQAVDDLSQQLEQVDGMKRRGLVLAFLINVALPSSPYHRVPSRGRAKFTLRIIKP